MDFLSALRISSSGLAAERVRVNLASSNLANAESTRGPDGKPYKRLDPVLQAVPFGDQLASAAGGGEAMGVQVAQVRQAETAGRRVYDPSHPDADAQGFVTLPDVNPIHEVVNLMSASRAYDANASAVETLKTMAQRALDIAR
ncbi:flagellar basal body rod protein FlgC [Anaeromyxobacter diazotrophicus]|uniref:Flagellar basal-body rod protein FlgC n=1 Tax=Anaeromyxobacter diazotrophicus TaxID=2590199 RepID=A0A7I9VLD2_9BACT|nr:flagellar basal body rod protein FlgC [Anaeromyxobacter diazotrophicus]GEJ56998.1 flagellar basal-body rod protein FlgC [Anaeromyxobacter diazotrophicus]